MTVFIGPVTKLRPWKVYTSYTTKDVLPQPGGLPDFIQEQTNYLSTTVPDTQQFYEVPGWREIVKQGNNAAAPYSRVLSSVNFIPGEAIARYLYTGVSPKRPASSEFRGVAALNYPSFVDVGPYLKADNMALTRFYGAIRAEYQHMQSLIFIGELGESVRMLRKPFKGIQDSVSKYLTNVDKRGKGLVTFYRRRRNPRKPTAAEFNNMLSEAWLETSFGWRPFLSDTVAIAETIARLQESPRRMRVQGFGENAGGGTASNNFTQDHSYIYTKVCQTDKTVWKVKYRAGLFASVSGPDGTAYRLRSLAGFQPEEFVPTVWNLLPWSFLADYFFNVGQVLSAHWTCTTDVRWAIQSNIGRTSRHIVSNVDHDNIRAALGVNYISSSGTRTWELKSETLQTARTILDPANLPVPLIDTKSFSEWNPLKVANVIALLKAKTKAVSGSLLTSSRG